MEHAKDYRANAAAGVGRGTWLAWFMVLAAMLAYSVASGAAAGPRPNVLWITCEDIGPHLGCYGDPLARTPNLDRLAQEGVRFVNAFTVTGVCAPSRSCLITFVYPASLVTHHMRFPAVLPAVVTGFPAYLRRAGYYCTNNVKEDYNFRTPNDVWDESSRQAHWRHRRPGQPFFSVFNLTVTHESQIRQPEANFLKLLHSLGGPSVDLQQLSVPPYHADTSLVRRDWARYYELIRVMDHQAGQILQQLAEDGLAEDTIVFFFSDHGAGLWRCKRWIYDSSLRVPLIIRFPQRFAHLAPAKLGDMCDRLVSFVDFAPTMLSLCGLAIPPAMQGQAFLGKHATVPRRYVSGARDRMDERYDMVRGVRDQRFHYLRHFYPHRPYAQVIAYMEEMPSLQEMRRLYVAGKLRGTAAQFFAPHKPVEELYDLQLDPHEVHNLAEDPQYRGVLERFRAEMRRWMLEIGDLGLLPEAEIHLRCGQRPPWDYAHSHAYQETLPRLYEAATTNDAARLLALAQDPDSGVRYWVAMRLGEVLGDRKPYDAVLRQLSQDASPMVRLGTAETLARLSDWNNAAAVLKPLLQHEQVWVRFHAAYLVDSFPPLRQRLAEDLRRLQSETHEYTLRIVRHALGEKR
ncbi:Arylsulfatase [bacterium HR36]|nr:Arylsulfatase [bacterium HR36]